MDPDLKYGLKLFSPELVLKEVGKHKNDVCVRFKMSPEDFEVMFSSLNLFINIALLPMPPPPSPKDLNNSTDFSASNENSGGGEMATITISVPERFNELKKRYPDVDWNEVLKRGILKRLEELKKFEELKKRGEL